MNEVQKKRGRRAKDDASRDEDRLVMARTALEIIEERGLHAMTARAVADRAGVSVGSIYTHAGDLEGLRMEANAITMRDLRRCLEASLARGAGSPPAERLVALAEAYAGFARTRRNAWEAMLAPRASEAPPAIAGEISGLFGLIGGVLRDAGLEPRLVPVATKALWASVHGMVHLGESNGLGPISPGDVPAMTRLLVSAAMRGLVDVPEVVGPGPGR